MNTAADRIKTARDRNAKALKLRPTIGQGTAVTRVRLDGGLACSIEEGPWRLTADMSEKHGGTGAGPNPGILGRGALGSCLAISYAAWAAQLNVPIQELEVEIQADYDARGEYGVDDVPPGYREVRYVVTVTSPASEAQVLRLLDEGDAHLAQREVQRRQLDCVRFRRSDAEDAHTWAGSLDAALCALGMMYFPDPIAALGRMCNQLRPGGRAVSAVWGARNRCGWSAIFPIVDSRVTSEVCPLFFQLGTGDNQAAAFSAAGFREATTDRLSVTLRYRSADDALGAAFIGGPVALAYSRFDDRTRAEVHAEYLASIEPYRRGDRYEIPGEFVVTRGRR